MSSHQYLVFLVYSSCITLISASVAWLEVLVFVKVLRTFSTEVEDSICAETVQESLFQGVQNIRAKTIILQYFSPPHPPRLYFLKYSVKGSNVVIELGSLGSVKGSMDLLHIRHSVFLELN